MFVRKNVKLKTLYQFTIGHVIWLTLWASFVTCTYQFTGWKWIIIPWLPISVIGTAVAFYVGFKNNSAYSRLWEARKIWGGIVNNSRSFATNIKAYISNQFTSENVTNDILFENKKRFIYRQIAWIYTLRSQLLIPTEWEHIRQNKHVRKTTEKNSRRFAGNVSREGVNPDELSPFIAEDELTAIMKFKNKATQLIDMQSQDLAKLREEDLIDDFRHMELQKLLNEFFNLQGKAERIKKFPLPRQYGSMSIIFVGIFIFLLPLGMIGEFSKMDGLGSHAIWLAIPFTILIGWVFLMMELVADYSENPFEGLGNDIPMLSLTRTIEIDLREMLGETDLPPAIEPINDVLM